MISQLLLLLSRMRANTIGILTIEQINIGLYLHLLLLCILLKGADVLT